MKKYSFKLLLDVDITAETRIEADAISDAYVAAIYASDTQRLCEILELDAIKCNKGVITGLTIRLVPESA